MALHVPRAPGMAQMLRQGTRVSNEFPQLLLYFNVLKYSFQHMFHVICYKYASYYVISHINSIIWISYQKVINFENNKQQLRIYTEHQATVGHLQTCNITSILQYYIYDEMLDLKHMFTPKFAS